MHAEPPTTMRIPLLLQEAHLDLFGFELESEEGLGYAVASDRYLSLAAVPGSQASGEAPSANEDASAPGAPLSGTLGLLSSLLGEQPTSSANTSGPLASPPPASTSDLMMGFVVTCIATLQAFKEAVRHASALADWPAYLKQFIPPSSCDWLCIFRDTGPPTPMPPPLLGPAAWTA